MRRTSDPGHSSRRLPFGVAIALLLPVGLVACSSGDGSSSDAGSSPTSTTSRTSTDDSSSEVQIRLIAFKPSELDVTAGTTVTWRQNDPGSHTVTSGTVDQGAGNVTVAPDGTFSSGELTTDENFEFAFAKAGTYPYYCEIHPATMRGEITVR